MKGDRSENNFFKNYPELLVFSYQGSKTSTSEGVKNVFKKARNWNNIRLYDVFIQDSPNEFSIFKQMNISRNIFKTCSS